jgi:hypothetical protein
MPANTVKRFFQHSSASVVHQNGMQLSPPSCGVEIILHTQINEQKPCCAEIISGNHYAEIGLYFEVKELVDYDGVFSLPREVGEMLNEAGYDVPQDCFASR